MTEGQPSQELSHVSSAGAAHMVDISNKAVSRRKAEARGSISMRPQTLQLVRENAAAKGDVLGVARLAGILAAKRTSELIPLCHALPLTSVDVDFQLDEESSRLNIVARASTDARSGVEMEALTAVTVAALTVYDMCKAVDRAMTISDVRLTYKSGGKSGTYRAE